MTENWATRLMELFSRYTHTSVTLRALITYLGGKTHEQGCECVRVYKRGIPYITQSSPFMLCLSWWLYVPGPTPGMVLLEGRVSVLGARSYITY